MPGIEPDTWQVDGEEFLLDPMFVSAKEPEQEPEPEQVRTVVYEQPAQAIIPPPPSEEPPPPAEKIVEALLFVGGPPLTAEKAAEAIRGFTADSFRDAIQLLTKTYQLQRRPYSIVKQGTGYVLAVKPEYRSLREKLFGGPHEARLSAPALDVLSLVAYRQPVSKAEIDSLRGMDSAGSLRQLVRLGLIAMTRLQRDGERTTSYHTTPRFLDLFQLASLDELPRLGEAQAIS